MKLVALLALLVAGCGSSSSPFDGGGAGTGGTDGASGAGGSTTDGSTADGGYSSCPQHRVEGAECASTTTTAGVLHKDGHVCATCIGRDATGQLTPQPVGCTTIASGGADLCVADCSECS
jgi:hypothetical protein